MDADQYNQGHPSNFLGSDSHMSKTSTESAKPEDEIHLRDFGTESNTSSIKVAPRQTEYKSYAEYLGQIKQIWPQYEDLWQCLDGKSDWDSFGAFRILIADSGKDGIKGNMWASNSSTGYTMSKKVVSRITTPPNENVQIRIIVLELALRRQALARDIVDAIGLTYDVDPAVLNAFFCYSRDKLDVSSRHSSRSPLPQKNTFLRFHGFCVGQVMHRPHPSGAPMKLVLVLSWLSGPLDPYVHGIALDGTPSIYNTLNEPLSRRSSFPFEKDGYIPGSHCQVYASWLFQLDQHQLNFNNVHPYEFIYPWIEYRMYDVEADICRLRLKLDQIRANFSRFGELGDPDERFNDEDLFSHANNVRDSLADALEVRRTLAKLGDAENKPKAEDIREYIQETVEDADRGLRIISEMQQTAIGTMAIQESRRSIKEAMAVKRLTQLAFVFIPLSYATSLFGMNISEMTGNGSKLWVFLVTSLALLISSMTFWWLSSQYQGKWSARMGAYLEDRKQIPSLKIRAKMIYAGIQTGHFKWMIREGIILGMITNGIFGADDYEFDMMRDKFYMAWHNERMRKKGKSKSSA